MQKELIYNMMNGFLTDIPRQENVAIEDEFAEGKECGRIYEKVYDAKRSLCDRLGEEEDRDIETIVSGLEEIGRLLAMKMYDYGRNGYGTKMLFETIQE